MPGLDYLTKRFVYYRRTSPAGFRVGVVMAQLEFHPGDDLNTVMNFIEASYASDPVFNWVNGREDQIKWPLNSRREFMLLIEGQVS